MFYRRRFTMETQAAGQRAWLVFDGIFYQSDVWLDGSYLGDTEGYFFPHVFDVTSALGARPDHLLALEVVCDRPARRAANRALTGVFGRWDCIDPAYNPGGIWAPVKIGVSGPVQMSSLRATCVEAGPKTAVVELSAGLDSAEALTVTLATQVRRSGGGKIAAAVEKRQPLAVGANSVRWQLVITEPDLWWPAGLGDQPLYDICVSVEAGGEQTSREVLAHRPPPSPGGEPGLVRERRAHLPERRQPGADAEGHCLRHCQRGSPGRGARPGRRPQFPPRARAHRPPGAVRRRGPPRCAPMAGHAPPPRLHGSPAPGSTPGGSGGRPARAPSVDRRLVRP